MLPSTEKFSDSDVSNLEAAPSAKGTEWHGLKSQVWSFLLSAVLEATDDDIDGCKDDLLSVTTTTTLDQVDETELLVVITEWMKDTLSLC